REDRVVAEAEVAAGREAQGPLHAALDHHGWALRPGDGERAGEPGREVLGAGLLQPLLDLLHGYGEVASGAGPAGGIDAGRALQRRDREAGIVGQGDQAARVRR